MNFFQNSVLNKHLKAQDAQAIKVAYAKFTAYFHNPEIQQNIREAKEEQFQEGFLRELFVAILGYTLNPSPNFNITTEYKNVKDSKKADGAILLNDHLPYAKVVAVIELKGTDTTDLGRIEGQAFGYKNNQADCIYVITSNFEKLRFYIENAIEHIEFNLFTLTEKEFELLWLCLAYTNIEKNVPKRIKDESLSQEDVITKSLYTDYSLFKRELHHNLVTLNPDHDPLTLFKKSQKLLDRFLFLFFAEDRQLLPPNSVRLILDDWRDLQDRDVEIALYSRFKKYFEYLNTGFKGKRYDVFAYNGGLFKTDVLLDGLKIEDELLFRHTLKLSDYDFVSEVDVNILGHIFENSLNELDEIKAQLEGQQADKSKSKRKKDGVFYTPKYITKYIVENTVGKLCTEKKAELGLIEEEYTTDRKRTTKTRQPLFDKLTTYRNWLLQLTICDPACGSGAFLNQSLDFLINEHRYIDELQAKLFGDDMVLSDFERNILENNLFGVDLNEESVEIAKLSLWLRTAQPNRKLNDLNNNIKCGNSLIDDPAMAGDKAFNWREEFPAVFPEKAKKAWHITTATHNSRYSQRMFENHVQLGEPVWLSEKEEIIVTQTIAKIVIEDKLNVLAYNICGDHMHLVLVCEDEELPSIMQKIKSMSARACNIAMGRTIPQAEEHAPRLEGERGTTQFHLWTQKFGCKEIVTEEQLNNTITYVQNNRIKHQISSPNTNDDGACSIAIGDITASFTCPVSHAFRTEYKGGFDVVIGNPPYVQLQSMGEISDILKNCGYETFDKGADLYCIFTERGYQLLKYGGIQSFIMPNKWMLVAYGKPLRKFLSTTGLRQVLNFGDIQFFQEAATIVCILVTQKIQPFENVEVLSLNQNTYNGDFITEIPSKIYNYPASKFSEEEWSIQPYNDSRKLEQMKLNGTELKDLPISINYGIKTGFNDAFFIDEDVRKELIDLDTKSSELITPMVRGRNIIAYGNFGSEYLINVHNGIKEKNPPLLPIRIESYPAIKKHLDGFYPMLEKRGDKGDTPYNLRNCAYWEEFSKPKIIYPNMTSVFPFMYDESGFFSNDKSFILTVNNNSVSLLFLTAVFNSSLAKLWIWYNCPELLGGTREIRKVYFEHFPVPHANEEQTTMLAQYATDRTKLTVSLQTLTSKFQRTIQRKFNLDDLPGKLQNWYLLTYKEFIAELAKKKVKLSLSEEAEWEAYFMQEAKQALVLKSEIYKTDQEIDRMVYQLYDLTEEEIKIEEGTN